MAINYTAEVGQRQYEDFGPILVKTSNYLRFYEVGMDTSMPLPILSYKLIKNYPFGIDDDEALGLYSQDFPLAERTV
jgi:hypothetical protein